MGWIFHRVIYYPTLSYGTRMGFHYYKTDLFFVRKKPWPFDHWVLYGRKPCRPTLPDLEIYRLKFYKHALQVHPNNVWDIQNCCGKCSWCYSTSRYYILCSVAGMSWSWSRRETGPPLRNQCLYSTSNPTLQTLTLALLLQA